MTKAELEAQKNTLLASGQPITASIHRNWAQKIIDELYDATSRGKVTATTDTVLSMASGDKVLIIRGSDAKLVSKDVFGSVDGGTATTRVNLIQLRKQTSGAWSAANPILANGEVGLETNTRRLKFGDGITTWNSLLYAGGGVSSFSAGDLSPLFTTTVDDASTSPALTFQITDAAANTFFAGPVTGPDAAPTYRSLAEADMPFNYVKTVTGGPVDVTDPQNPDVRFTGIAEALQYDNAVTTAQNIFLNGGSAAFHVGPISNPSAIRVNGDGTVELNLTGDATGDMYRRSSAGVLERRTPTQVLTDIAALPLAGGTLTGDLTLAGLPTNALHAATKSYVDNLITGLTWKSEVACATTANITLSGEQTIDGVLTSVSRVLVKNQSTASQNGLWLTGPGAWTRTTDADTGAELAGATVFVAEGTANANTQWSCSNVSITLGSTNVTFVKISGAGTYTADGTTLNLTGNVFSISASYVGQASITTLGTIATGTWNATTIAINKGGTNNTTFTTNGVTFYNGTSITSSSSLIYDGSLFGIGLTPTSRFHVQGAAALTASMVKFQNSTPTVLFDMLESGATTFTGAASGANAAPYAFNPTVTATANSQTQYAIDVNMTLVDGGFTTLTRSFARFRTGGLSTNIYDFGTSTFTTTGLTSADFNGGSMRLRNTTGPFNIQGGSGSTDVIRFSGVFTNATDNHIAFRFTNGGSANNTALHTAGTAITRTWNAIISDWTVSSVNGSTITYNINRVIPTFALGNSTATITGYDYAPDLSGSSGTITHYAMRVRSGLSAFGHSNAPTAFMDLAASTAAAAPLRIRTGGTVPSSPNDGEIWPDGNDLKMRIGGVTKTFTLV